MTECETDRLFVAYVVRVQCGNDVVSLHYAFQRVHTKGQKIKSHLFASHRVILLIIAVIRRSPLTCHSSNQSLPSSRATATRHALLQRAKPVRSDCTVLKSIAAEMVCDGLNEWAVSGEEGGRVIWWEQRKPWHQIALSVWGWTLQDSVY